jgi:predicted PurR-regulated permease PerM
MAEITPGDEILVTRWPWVLGVAALAALLFYLLHPILTPFVLGALLGYFGDPLVDLLERWRVNRTLGVVLVFLVFTLGMVLVALFTLPRLAEQLDALITKLPGIYEWLGNVALPWLRETLNLPDTALPTLEWGKGQLAENWQSLGKWLANTGKQVTGSGMGILAGLANLALVPVVAFYLMRDWDLLMAKFRGLLPLDWQAGVSEVAVEADEVIGAFFRGQLIVMVALGVIYGTGLWLVGVQLAVALGVIAGLASIVPYLGFVVGISASLIAAYAQVQDWTLLLWVFLVFAIGQVLESMVLTPVLVGDRIGLHPVAVIFALMAGAQLAGFVGVLVALPVAAVIMVFLRHGLHYYHSSNIYSGGNSE